MGQIKQKHQWLVGFALETEDQRFRALTKLEKKSCNLMVLNGLQALHSLDNEVEIIDRRGRVVQAFGGSKEDVARGILRIVHERLIAPKRKPARSLQK